MERLHWCCWWCNGSGLLLLDGISLRSSLLAVECAGRLQWLVLSLGQVPGMGGVRNIRETLNHY